MRIKKIYWNYGKAQTLKGVENLHLVYFEDSSHKLFSDSQLVKINLKIWSLK